MMEWGHQAPRRRREDEWDNREAVADLLRECDRYREALERIASVPDNRYVGPRSKIARQALEGEQE